MKELIILFIALATYSVLPVYGYDMCDGQSNICASNGTLVVSEGNTHADLETWKAGAERGEYPQTEIDAAIAAIEDEVGTSNDNNILEIANTAKQEIENSLNGTKIKEIKDLAIYKIRTVKDINTKIGNRTHQLFYNVVISDKITLLKHAQSQNDAEDIRVEIMSRLELAVWVYDSAKAEDFGIMSEPCTSCTAVKVKKGDKIVTLYAPESVEYIKVAE